MAKTALKQLDGLISQFEQLHREYPACEAYDKTLSKLHTQRAELTSQIGRRVK